ncbi:MAG: bifunctional transaldolase/phosoglucose isomerase [Anaerolineaceae bacterium]|nr:bifunctional transaldolase/phosoglucose isomerase [Anaerolineaceae bacterium]
MSAIEKLHQLGQSLWYDNIERRILENGELAKLIDDGEIRGVTSNPSIFNNAISRSNDYDAALKPMAWSGWDAEQIFYQLAIEDIRVAADLFFPLYQSSEKKDGYVSLEVNPLLANNTEATLKEVRELWKRVERPNLMIKIPATPEGIPAIKTAIAEGFNINVTLIFSLQRYQQVIEAYLSGLEERVASGLPIDSIASVASFFVSRLDTKIDAQLQEIIREGDKTSKFALDLLGKAAIANARLAYQLFLESVQSPRFAALKQKGAQVQRPLWASTSTKNPNYLDVLYVNELIGPDTVNTTPPQTLDAFRDHGLVKATLDKPRNLSEATLQDIGKLGISLDQATKELEEEGVKSFKDAFANLLSSIETRRIQAAKELNPLGNIPDRVQKLKKASAVKRMFDHDPTLWTQDQAGQQEIKIRLGWLQAPLSSQTLLPSLDALFIECQQEGITHGLLLGMGGSSLAPEVLSRTFGVREAEGKPGIQLKIVDSTDPNQIRAAARISPIEKTIYIVSSKSGTTSEVDALFKYFYHRAKRKLVDRASSHFIAITDPNTPLEKMALDLGFRRVIQADPNVGGRYSALTAFGLGPAALLGLDTKSLLACAGSMMHQCMPETPDERNPGLVLGAILGEATLQGKNKLTILADPEFSAFGSWLEQLVAESSGKQEKGIVPVDNEPVASKNIYENDRLFIYLQGSGKLSKTTTALRKAGHPVLTFTIPNAYHIAAEFYRWEVAIAIACAILNINAFDQPDVQDSKNRTRQKIAYFEEHGKLEHEQPDWENENLALFIYPKPKDTKVHSSQEAIAHFLAGTKTGNYIALNAYLPRNTAVAAQLQKIRGYIQRQTHAATTLGFGPRFLHSTGQLHKGGPNIGRFIQITAAHDQDIDIPDSSLTFATLQLAQAQGDLEALTARNRQVLRIHLKKTGWENLIAYFSDEIK